MFLRHPLKRVRPTYVTYFLRFRFDFINRMSTQKPFEGNFRGFFRLYHRWTLKESATS